MKKILSVILAILMIATAAPMALAVHDDEHVYTSGYYSYFFDEEGRAIICGYSGTEKDVVVPAQLDGYDIYAIDHYVFKNNQYIETAVVSEGIEMLGGDVFDSCPLLKSVVIPDSVAELGIDCNFGTIGNCPVLETVTLGKNLYAFYGYELAECPNLKEIIIPEENPYLICEDLVVYTKNRKTLVAFLDYYAESFTVPAEVRVIGAESFENSLIKNIEFNDGLLYIAYFAFASCKNLTDVVLPGSLQSVGRFIFRNCASLTNVTLPEGLVNISDGMLDGCLNLKNVYVPAGLESVNEEAFYTFKSDEVPVINFWYGGNEEQWEALAVDTLESVPNVYYNHTHSINCTDTYSVCDECGLTYSNNHAWKQTALVYPENGEDGYIDLMCLTDPAHTKREIISANELKAADFYAVMKEMKRICTEVDWVDSMMEALAEEYELSQLEALEYIYGERYVILGVSMEEVDAYYGEAIRSGLYTKPDYAEYDELVACIEKAIADGKLDPANQVVLDEIKAVIDEIRADGENTKAAYQSVVDECAATLQEIKAEIPADPEIPEDPDVSDEPVDPEIQPDDSSMTKEDAMNILIKLITNIIDILMTIVRFFTAA